MSTEAALLHFRTQFEKKVILPDEVWLAVVAKCRLLQFKKGDFILQNGQIEPYVAFVDKGIIRAYHLKDGEEICVAFTWDGYYCSSFASFLSRKPSNYTIECLSDCTLVAIEHGDLQLLFNQYQLVERWGRLAAEEVLIGKENREVEMLSFSAEERYHRIYQQSPQLFQLVSQKHIASYLGMKPETFSRLRKKFAKL